LQSSVKNGNKTDTVDYTHFLCNTIKS